MTVLLGGFNPNTETYPSTAAAYNVNRITADSSGELALTPTAIGDWTLARSTAFANSGAYSTRATLTLANAGTDAWVKMACNVPAGTARTASVRIYVPAGSLFIGQLIYMGYGTGAGPPTSSPFSSITLVAGWQTMTLDLGTATVDFVAVGTLTSASYGASLDGLPIYFDDWFIGPTSGGTAWQPISGEPFYNAGQTWTITAAGVFQGLAMVVGDILTCTVGTNSLYTAATWTATHSATTIETALQQRPTNDVGHPTGLADWRLGVQILLPGDGSSQWGSGIWGTSTWTSLQWFDITEYVRGMTWNRGADEFDGRPRVGVATVTLDNSAYNFSPVDPTNSYNHIVFKDTSNNIVNNYFGPGTIMRIVAHSPTGYLIYAQNDAANTWVPQITGVVESWPETREHSGVESYINVTFTETLSTLARVNDNALAAVVGDNETAYVRMQRLGNAASWKFGYVNYHGTSFDSEVLQSTDMSLNRLAEIYLTADSLMGGVIRSDRSGAMALTSKYFPSEVLRGPLHYPEFYAINLATWPTTSALPWTVEITTESFVVDNDTEPVINVAQYSRVGGAVQTYSNTASITKYGRISTGRSDLINKSNTDTLTIASNVVDDRSNLTKRFHTAKVDGYTSPRALAALISLDVQNVINNFVVSTRDGKMINAPLVYVDGMTHNVTPADALSWHWTAEYTFGRQNQIKYATTPPDEAFTVANYLWPYTINDNRVGYARVGYALVG